jgi:hypothetical protein
VLLPVDAVDQFTAAHEQQLRQGVEADRPGQQPVQGGFIGDALQRRDPLQLLAQPGQAERALLQRGLALVAQAFGQLAPGVVGAALRGLVVLHDRDGAERAGTQGQAQAGPAQQPAEAATEQVAF